MELPFVKMHGLGNDFVFLEDLADELALSEGQVRWLCDRHFGIGADGVIVVKPADDPSCTARMHYINADGTLAQMCGNGVRCFAKYLVDHGIVGPEATELRAQTLAGPRDIRFKRDAEGRMARATVDMGAPILEPAQVPVAAQANATAEDGTPCVRELPLESPWGTFSFTCVSMGNPHAVCFPDVPALPDELFADPADKRLETLDLDRVGAFFERHEAFPEKTNVEFARVDGEGRLTMRVFERGCGETLACGTGTCATVVAAALTGRSGRAADVTLLGGVLHIEWTAEGRVLMTGPAATSFQGTVEV